MTYTHVRLQYVVVGFLLLLFLLLPGSFVQAVEIEVISGEESGNINVVEIASSTPPISGGSTTQTGATSSVIITVHGDGTETSAGSFSTTTGIIITIDDPQNSKLLTENRVNPVDIFDSTPEFSALYTNTHKSLVGTEYDIQVSPSPTFQPVWWTGSGIFSVPVKVGTRTPQISYGGIPLASSTPYYWRMRIRDNSTKYTGNKGAWSTTTATFSLARANARPTVPTGLLLEGVVNPTNVTDSTPEFSAIFNDPDAVDIARKYEIQVSTSTKFTPLWWDSGIVTFTSTTSSGTRIVDIPYTGTKLASSTPYYWRIRFWDSRNLGGPWSTRASFRLK